MMPTRLPVCRLVAVGSKPWYSATWPPSSARRSPGSSEICATNPRALSVSTTLRAVAVMVAHILRSDADPLTELVDEQRFGDQRVDAASLVDDVGQGEADPNARQAVRVGGGKASAAHEEVDRVAFCNSEPFVQVGMDPEHDPVRSGLRHRPRPARL